jgi:hypothetical protein
VHYYFLVASRHALNIDDPVGYSDYLRGRLGNVGYTGAPYASMKALIAEVLPPQPDDDWTTALYIAYGSDRRDLREERIYRLVRCADGTFYWVPLDASFGCPLTVPDSMAIPADTLNEDGEETDAKARPQRKDQVLVFDPANAPAASDLLRRPVTRIERPPLAPAPSNQPRTGSSTRRSEPVLSGAIGTAGSGVTGSAVTTPAQEPSNPRGRVTQPESDGGGQPPQ